MTISCLAVKGFLAEFPAFRSSMGVATTSSQASYLSSHFQSKPGAPPLMEVDIFQPCVMKIPWFPFDVDTKTPGAVLFHQYYRSQQSQQAEKMS
jgi:hypothetical protein